ncbi:MAG: ATP-binding cassette domain-containing protein [Pseudomonadota bacterium]
MTNLAIQCENVSKRYPHFHLNSINLTVPEGSVMGFVGPNGAGKSTTMRILMGLLTYEQGSVSVLGHAIPKAQIAAKRDINELF